MGIIGAMDVEIALLREEMAKAGAVKITRIAGMEFNVGTIGNATVIVVQCGVGMVNAATCAQVLVDRFVRDNFEKQRIIETFGAKCCEMEGAAIAQVAWANGVPCAIVRAISDKADGSSSMDYPTFEAQAARNSAALVIAMLKRQG